MSPYRPLSHAHVPDAHRSIAPARDRQLLIIIHNINPCLCVSMREPEWMNMNGKERAWLTLIHAQAYTHSLLLLRMSEHLCEWMRNQQSLSFSLPYRHRVNDRLQEGDESEARMTLPFPLSRVWPNARVVIHARVGISWTLSPVHPFLDGCYFMVELEMSLNVLSFLPA